MHPRSFAPVVAALLLVASSGPGSAQAPAAPLVIDAGVVEVRSGTLRPDMRIVVEEGVIVRLGSARDVPMPEGARHVDARGRWVIPGLWDMHVHLDPTGFEGTFPLLIANGVLGVRDMGGDDVGRLVALRDSVERGALLGPRMVVAGRMLDGPTPDWPFRITVEDSASAWEAVARQKEAGVDFVKVHGQLAADPYPHIFAAAEAHGLSVAGHVPAAVGLAGALTAGQRSLEHLIGLPPCGTPATGFRPDSTGTCPNPLFHDAKAQLVDAGAWQTPTLIVHWNNTFQDDSAFLAGDTLKAYRTPEAEAFWELQRQANGPLPPLAARRAFLEGLVRATGELAEAGVPILAATDLGFLYTYPGFSLHEELALLVEAGLTPHQALYAATRGPARFLDLGEHAGTVEEGAPADLVILQTNPLEDIRSTVRIEGVVRSGAYLDRATLDRMLSDSRQAR